MVLFSLHILFKFEMTNSPWHSVQLRAHMLLVSRLHFYRFYSQDREQDPPVLHNMRQKISQFAVFHGLVNYDYRARSLHLR